MDRENQIVLSVIIPVYNTELFLEQCLKSVLSQSLTKLEVICIDDGSTDRSIEIIKRFQIKDKRLILLSQDHNGAGAARNLGLRHCRGKYVHFLDSDDWLEDDAYLKAYEAINKTEADICVFMYKRYDNKTGVERPIKLFPQKPGSIKVTTFEDDYRYFCNTSVVPWNKIYSTDYLRNINAYFDEIVCANDRAFYYQVVKNAGRIALFADYLIYYRENNENSLVGQGRAKHFDCHMTANRRIFEMCKDLPKEMYEKILDSNFLDLYSFYPKSNKENKLENFRLLSKLLEEEISTNKLATFNDKSWYIGAQISSLFNKLNTNKTIIPIVFATNNNYAPFCDIAILSLLSNRSCSYYYDIYILQTDLSKSNINMLQRHKGENYRVNCIDVKSKFSSLQLYSRAHYSKEMYYRIFIAEFFYHYDKVLYLDCDIIVNRDVADLFNIDLGNASIGAVHNALNDSMYRYVTRMLKLLPENYFNSGVLIINVDEFVANKIKTKCFDLIKCKNDLVCPDQDLLNLACRDTFSLIDSGWNFQWHGTLSDSERVVSISESSLQNAQEKKYITHFTSGRKAWVFPEFENAIDFWMYVDQSEYSTIIKQIGICKRIQSEVRNLGQTFSKQGLTENNVSNEKFIKLNSKYEKELKDIKKSLSFRIGRIITWMPRKIRDIFIKRNKKNRKNYN